MLKAINKQANAFITYLKCFVKSTKPLIIKFLYWLALAVLLGTLCGILGGFFAKSITFATNLRSENKWLIYLLPFGGLLSVGIYKICRVSSVGTNNLFKSTYSEKTISVLLAPAIFLGSFITHLCGGSAGREGAALQLGGSISALLSKIFRIDEKSRRILTLCGMGALFSAVFGTPIAAFVFALEVVCVGTFCYTALFPAMISSFTAYGISSILGIRPESFPLTDVSAFSIDTVWRVALIAAICGIVSIAFCYILRFTDKIFKRFFKNDFLRIFIGGSAIVLLSIIVGTSDYNGSGIDVIGRIFTDGTVNYEAFALKILFTTITVAAGFKGGEIIPTLFIGATLGGTLAVLLGLNTSFGAAVGMAALFCGVTNCPLASILLSIELFGSQGAVFFTISSVISFMLSGKVSLYSAQLHTNDKESLEFISK